MARFALEGPHNGPDRLTLEQPIEDIKTMEDFTKIYRIGRIEHRPDYCVNLFVKAQFKAGRLSITGVEGPKANGNAFGSCGQIIMHEWTMKEYAPGWSPQTVERFRNVWDLWHLNDMQPGTSVQMAHLRAIEPYTYDSKKSHYEWAKEKLKEAGLEPHNGYSYGSAWLKVEVPEEVLEFLKALPDADIQPAWV